MKITLKQPYSWRSKRLLPSFLRGTHLFLVILIFFSSNVCENNCDSFEKFLKIFRDLAKNHLLVDHLLVDRACTRMAIYSCILTEIKLLLFL